MTSPVLISAEAAFTRVGVRRLMRPIYNSCKQNCVVKIERGSTLSFSPQTHAAPGGAPGIDGNCFRVGKMVESGSKGEVVAVLLKVRKSFTCVSRFWVEDDVPSDMLTGWIQRRNRHETKKNVVRQGLLTMLTFGPCANSVYSASFPRLPRYPSFLVGVWRRCRGYNGVGESSRRYSRSQKC